MASFPFPETMEEWKAEDSSQENKTPPKQKSCRQLPHLEERLPGPPPISRGGRTDSSLVAEVTVSQIPLLPIPPSPPHPPTIPVSNRMQCRTRLIIYFFFPCILPPGDTLTHSHIIHTHLQGCYGMFCPCCLASRNLKLLGQSSTCCGFPCRSLTSVREARRNARLRYGVKAPGCLGECCASGCFALCANIQVAREISAHRDAARRNSSASEMSSPPELAMSHL